MWGYVHKPLLLKQQGIYYYVNHLVYTHACKHITVYRLLILDSHANII